MIIKAENGVPAPGPRAYVTARHVGIAYNPCMTIFRRVALLLLTLAFAGAASAQQPSLRDIPKDTKAGYLSHLAENVFTLDGKRIQLAPGGTIRGVNNLVITPNMLPRESLVRYQTDGDGNLAKAWVLSRDEAAKVNVGVRFPWQTSPETGTSINQVLPAPTQSGTTQQR